MSEDSRAESVGSSDAKPSPVSNSGASPKNKKPPRKSKGWSKHRKRSIFLKRRAEYEMKRRRRRKKLLRSLENRRKLTPKQPNAFLPMPAPNNFDFLENTEEVQGYFKECRKALWSREQIVFDLDGVDSLSADAVAVLVANVKNPSFTRGLRVNGTIPTKEGPKKLFVESRFLEHVRSGYISGQGNNNLLVHKVTDIKVENELAKQICETAVAHTFGDKSKFRPIYETLIECMANTNNHAALDKSKKYNWWLFLYLNPNGVSSFTFLDLGVGIFSSLPVQRYRKIVAALTGITPDFNRNLIPDLFAGKVSSRTGEKDRGKGLPLIYLHSKNPLIQRFTIVSNDVHVKIPSQQSKTLKNRFQGTVLYWELHPRSK